VVVPEYAGVLPARWPSNPEIPYPHGLRKIQAMPKPRFPRPRHLRAACVLLSLAGAAALPAADTKTPPTDDQKLIQGTWQCVVTIYGGKQDPHYVGVRAVIEGNHLTWVFPQPGGAPPKTQKAVFHLDPGQNPRQMDWYPESNPSDVHRRLYVLEGDLLLMSTNLRNESPREGVRPTSISAAPWLFVCKRVRPE
jgi:uncharacterized protein (TIGR03067 family)